MIEVALCKISGSQFVEKKQKQKQKNKNRNRRGEEIEAIAILLRLSNKLIPKRIGHRKLEVTPSNCIYSYPECVLEYKRHLAPRYIVGKIWEDAYKVSFADFWSSVESTFMKYKIIDSHEFCKVMIYFRWRKK